MGNLKVVNSKNVFKIIFISVLVFIVSIFLMSLKQNTFIDEIRTFGLANHSFIPVSQNYKSYSGEELILEYASVQKGNEFNFKQVFDNQANDTHPPVFYILLNIICSFNSGKWSLGYGLIINAFLSIFIFWNLRWIYTKLIDDKRDATLISFFSLFLNCFICTIVLIRMYCLLVAISLSFFNLVINEIYFKKNNNNVLFYISFSILIILGTLTHYHFLVVGGIIGIYLCINLLKEKKYKKLIIIMVLAIFSLIISYLIFPDMLKHLFNSNSPHHIGNIGGNQIVTNIINSLRYIYEDVFNLSFFIYILLAMVFFFISLKKKKNDKQQEKSLIDITRHKILFFISILLVIYFVVIIFTIKFTGNRYLSNFFTFFTILIFSTFYNLCVKIFKSKIVFMALLIITVLSSNIKPPFYLYIGDNYITNFFNENKDVKTVLCYNNKSKVEISRCYYNIRNVKDITLMDYSLNNYQQYGDVKNFNELMVIIFTPNTEQSFGDSFFKNVLDALASQNNVNSYDLAMEASFYRVYKLYQN